MRVSVKHVVVFDVTAVHTQHSLLIDYKFDTSLRDIVVTKLSPRSSLASLSGSLSITRASICPRTVDLLSCLTDCHALEILYRACLLSNPVLFRRHNGSMAWNVAMQTSALILTIRAS